MDMFLQAGVLWNITMGQPPRPEFEVNIVTADGQPITALNNIPVIPKCSMYEVAEVDLIVIPSQGFFYDIKSNVHWERDQRPISEPCHRLSVGFRRSR